MAVSPEFLAHLEELLAGLGRMRVKKMFGGASLSVDDAAFALVFGETLYLKVDDDNRAAFEGEGSAPFTYAMKDGRIIFLVQDQGPGFDYDHLPDPTDPQNLEKPHGRGVFLMRALAEEVEFQDQGATVTMAFRIDAAQE